MSTVEEAEKLLSKMTPGEKAQLLKRGAQESEDAYPGIDMIDGVCGGDPIIDRTRIPVWVLEQAPLARICKPNGRRRPQSTSNEYDEGQPTPIFRGRL